MSKNVVICGFARSPFTPAKKGSLAKIRPDDLAAEVVKGLIKKHSININDVEDLILGCAFPEAEQGMNLARNVVFLSGLPNSVGGVTVNRFCASSMQAIHQAAGAINSGSGELFIAGGVESMSRVPMAGFNPMLNPSLVDVDAYIGMGHTAENLARDHSISREEQEQMALESHQKASAAQENNQFNNEIIAIGDVSKDGCVRPETSLESMSKLKPAFDKNGVVTAGTSSPLTDGAAAVIVCSEEYAKKSGLKIMAYIRGMAISGCDPKIMGIGPVLSSQKALKRAGIRLEDVDIIEMNEAFAAQSLACVKELGIDMSKLNVHGGAISLGHPLGASGARITGKAASLLQETGKRYALSTMCVGGGQGCATVLERA
ncbi:MAG: acetyl-CoA acetyltransferase [Marine Group III euryarchaeote CG-Epi3]|jgi:acetyl-CoA acyltransferase|uniref:acetyl-CoA C-acyltransferase n=1 Tax=Marine Group III euryarchaeote CG-Epi3 TaxID=1888997 RepID=A0A1J5UBJ1_9ARCH|nr:MAG: acetyl-CoA acetyltransferase [Marine Group III euryarchaeote CG-Epi3]